MNRMTLPAAALMLALAGCDQIPFLQGDSAEGNVATANAADSNAAAVADAGITSSRSLAGPGDNAAAEGGKDPAAVPAGAAQGAIDPRLVGRWSDIGDCKTSAELRADGSFVAANGAMGRWHVEGGDLVFSGAAGVIRLRLDSVEPDRIVTTNSQGQTGQSTRC